MNKKVESLTIEGVEYVPKDSIIPLAQTDGKEFVIIRSADSGVHAGYLESKDGREVTLVNSIRIWYWDGAASLSQLAVDGPGQPDKCKFAVVLPKITVLGVCEIIPCTQKAKDVIEGVKTWKV